MSGAYVRVEKLIDAEAKNLFNIVAAPGQHPAIDGSGPNGLAAAVYLARAGCHVHVLEQAPYCRRLKEMPLSPITLPSPQNVLNGYGRTYAECRCARPMLHNPSSPRTTTFRYDLSHLSRTLNST